jgi:predicted dehydrogenase
MDKTPTPLNWALIGCGGIGRAQVRWAADTPDIRAHAFCDINEAAARTLSETHADSYYTTDPGKIFRDSEIDIVSIATTHDTHKDLALAAFAAGKHVFLEKPMAMNSEDCLAISRAHKEAGTQLMLDFSIRFSQAAQKIKERLGPLKASHVQCTQGAADLSTWRWHPTLGGGPLYDVGVHALDLLCWQHGSAPVEVYATGGQVTHAGQLDSADMIDTAAATLRFADGAVATFLMTDAGRNELLSKWFFEFFDGEHTAVLHEHFKTATFSKPNPTTGELESETLRLGESPRFQPLVDAILHGKPLPAGPREGFVSALLVEKITASIHSGQVQTIDIPCELF